MPVHVALEVTINYTVWLIMLPSRFFVQFLLPMCPLSGFTGDTRESGRSSRPKYLRRIPGPGYVEGSETTVHPLVETSPVFYEVRTRARQAITRSRTENNERCVIPRAMPDWPTMLVSIVSLMPSYDDCHGLSLSELVANQHIPYPCQLEPWGPISLNTLFPPFCCAFCLRRCCTHFALADFQCSFSFEKHASHAAMTGVRQQARALG